MLKVHGTQAALYVPLLLWLLCWLRCLQVVDAEETYTTLWLGDQYVWHTQQAPVFNVTTYTGAVYVTSYPPWCQQAVGGGQGEYLSRFCDLCNAFQEEYWEAWRTGGTFHLYYNITPMYVLYGIMVALTIAFFTCERSRVHKNAMTEMVTLWLILAFALLPTALFFKLKFFRPTELEGYFRCHEMVQYIAAGYLMLVVGRDALFEHPDFHGGRSTMAGTPRQLMAEFKPKPTPKGLRVLEQCREESGQIVTLAWVEKCGKVVVPLLLFLTILADLSLIDTDMSSAVNIISIVLICLVLLMVLVASIVSFVSYRGAVKRIGAMIEVLIQQRQEENLHYVVAHMELQKLIRTSRRLRETILLKPLESGMYDTYMKAVCVDAVMKLELGVALNRGLQKAIVEIIKSCEGEELTLLKTLVDGSGHYLNLYKLIYTDLHPNMRKSILEHISTEARKVRRQLGVQGVKVLSDIDDTHKASGGLPAGLDKKYPKKSLYPGCFTMYKCLDRGFDCKKPSCNLVFLSARPHTFKGAQEENVYSPMVPLYENQFVHSFPTLLPGDFRKSIAAGIAQFVIGTRAWRSVGEAKYETYRSFRALYEEYDFVFCGDDGQGDLLAGQMMLQEPSQKNKDSPKVLAVLIHEILPDNKRPAQVVSEEQGKVEQNDAWRAGWLERGLVLHKTYVGAAAALHKRDPGYISAEDVAEIARKAVEEFTTIVGTTTDRSAEDWEPALDELRKDLQKASDICKAAGLPDLPRIPPLSHLCDEEVHAPPSSSTQEASPLIQASS